MAKDSFEAGMETRRAVLGDAHVDRAQKNLTEFNQEFQDFITRYAWGEIWTRPGLDRKTRSCMTLAMLMALNRSEEFQLHIRAARNNGLTWGQIKEVMLHAAIYAGVPAANQAFKLAEQIKEEEKKRPQDHGTTGPRDREETTTRPRDHATTRPGKKRSRK